MRKLTTTEWMIVIAIICIIANGASIINNLFKNKNTQVEVIEPIATLKNTNADLIYDRNNNRNMYKITPNITPKVFFKLKDGRIINIHLVRFSGVEWEHGNLEAISLTGSEKIRFQEWIDSWGVLTMESK